LLRALLHPDHVAMTAFRQPLAQPLARSRRGVGARDADRGETQP